MDRRTSLLERIRPYSFSALLLAIACLAAATLLRLGFGWLGVSLPFGTFYPAVLVASLLAGAPAGIGVIAGAILVAWWAFIPPYYEFTSLNPTADRQFHAFHFLERLHCGAGDIPSRRFAAFARARS